MASTVPSVRLIGHKDLPKGFSLYELDGVSQFPVYADGPLKTYPISYVVNHPPCESPSMQKLFTYSFRVNEPIKDAVREFKRFLDR